MFILYETKVSVFSRLITTIHIIIIYIASFIYSLPFARLISYKYIHYSSSVYRWIACLFQYSHNTKTKKLVYAFCFFFPVNINIKYKKKTKKNRRSSFIALVFECESQMLYSGWKNSQDSNTDATMT